jgi:serine/threonine-protein kinase RsbW
MPAPPCAEIRFSGNHDGFARAFTQLREALDGERLDDVSRYNLELVFEEVVANIINYGTADGREPDVCVILDSRSAEVVLTFEDDGRPFDPTIHTARPQARSLEEARVGGFGLILVRKAASSLNYIRTREGRNRLTVSVRR